jgi:hypothetical protein
MFSGTKGVGLIRYITYNFSSLDSPVVPIWILNNPYNGFITFLLQLITGGICVLSTLSDSYPATSAKQIGIFYLLNSLHV